MNKTELKTKNRTARHNRIRARVSGTAARPRLAVYKSNRYLHAQLVDDETRTTLVGASTKDVAPKAKKMDGAKALGEEMAKRAKGLGITEVVFDRGGFRYIGRVATFADAVRAGGIKL